MSIEPESPPQSTHGTGPGQPSSLPVPLPLPAAAIPHGCPPWDGEQARRWTDALPPRWVPVRWRSRFVQAAVAAATAAALVPAQTGLPAYLAALLSLHLVWVVVRPEVVRFTAPVLAVAFAARQPTPPWAQILAVALLAGVSFSLAGLRARARTRQRQLALAASGGVTAPLPDAGSPLRRGRFLAVLGLLLLVPGGSVLATGGLWDAADDRRAAAAFGCLAVGLGLTVLTSAALGRHRAARLRAAPAPVLRVLVRDDAHGDTEVFAADDVLAGRALFTVAVSELADDGTDDGSHGDEGDEGENEDDDLDDLLDRLEDDEAGPLREAVLYGVPYDGAEVLIVSADDDPDEPPLVEWSTGPVRPLSHRAAARRTAAAERAAARAAEERHQASRVVGHVVERDTPVPVRRWRAGWLDWLAAALLAQCGVWLCWAAFTEAELSLWKQFLVIGTGLLGAARIAVKLCWRVTADRTGLWINGLFKPTHVPWDDLRSVRREFLELKIRRRGGESWAIAAPRWSRLQRRWSLTHPYDTLAAELTALLTDPALRPTEESGERERGRPLWPLAALLAVVWVTVVVVTRSRM